MDWPPPKNRCWSQPIASSRPCRTRPRSMHIQAYECKIGPHNGAQVVAKAWTDPAFKQALLDDAARAGSTLGHVSRVGDHLVAVGNMTQRHNMVVCTLCSCYPLEM